MEKELLDTKNNHHGEEITRLIIKSVLPIVLLLGGLWLLTLRLAGWSIIFGLPMVILGIVFVIYAYDDAVSGKVAVPIDKFKNEEINY